MAQYLTEVFPTLKLEDSLDEVLSEVVVLKVARTSKGDVIRIHVSEEQQVERALLNKTELEIQRQLFPGQPVTVKIVVEEMPEPIHIIEENVEHAHTDWETSETGETRPASNPEPPDSESAPIGEGEPDYTDGYEDLAAAVAERYEQAAKAPKPKQPDSQWQGKYPRKSSRKRSANPDVLYGRDFDDDPIIPIEDIVGELGVVLIRGQIASLDLRSIKNDRTILSFCLTDFADSIMSSYLLTMRCWTKPRRESRWGPLSKSKGRCRRTGMTAS
jgi:DNA polymerase III alpha subunit (gram-positive type)